MSLEVMLFLDLWFRIVMCDKKQTFRTESRKTKVENEEMNGFRKREKGCILI